MLSRPPQWPFAVLAVVTAGMIVWLTLALVACAPRASAPAVPAMPRPPGVGQPLPAAPASTPERERANAAADDAARYKGLWAEAEAKAKHEAERAEKAEAEKRLAPVRTLIVWLTGAAVLFGALSAGAAVFLSPRLMLTIAAGCGVVAVALQGADQALDHVVWAGAALAVLIASAVGIMLWRHRQQECGTAAACAVAESLKPDPASELPSERDARRTAQATIVGQFGKAAERVVTRARILAAKKLGGG